MSNTSLERVLEILDEINAIPRQSHHLEKIHSWLMNWGGEKGFSTETDEALNVLIKVPASPGYEAAPTIILQGHMDMVCEKRPGIDHDFQKDSIRSWRDGDWLRGEGTSLGADNGVALALFFDLITDPEAEHPALEVLITSNEETGLVGAQALKPGFLSGKVLLNLDSEDEGVFTIGCAGGKDTNILLPVDCEDIPLGYLAQWLNVGGLEGGHSGIEIHVGKANANVLLVRCLREILEELPQARFGAFHGGTAHNAIPREARGLIALPSGQKDKLKTIVDKLEKMLQSEYSVTEKGLFIRLEQIDEPKEPLFTPAAGKRLIDALRLIPHGVRSMSAHIEGMVETSMNFAVIRTEEDKVKVLTNQRSAVKSRGDDLSESIFSLARLYGGTYTTGNAYPEWEPQGESDVLNRARAVWKELFGEEPEVEVTHAGLECGAIGAQFPGLDMISFGPTIMQPHSPDERMLIPSVGKVQTFFRELLKSYKSV